MPVFKNIQIQHKGNKEQSDVYCPVCGDKVRPGYDTRYGRVVVCRNYPRCSFFAMIDFKDNQLGGRNA